MPTPAVDWSAVRREFNLELDRVNFAGLVAASHPRVVAAAIEAHRHALDRQWPHIKGALLDAEAAACRAAGAFFDCDPGHVALTGSTTEGLAHLYAGLRLEPDRDEMLTSEHEFSFVREMLELRHERDQVPLRRFRVYRG